MNSHQLFIHRLAIAATVLASVVIIFGAFTRLVDAGLGCPDWPGCYGHLTWPTTAGEIAKAEMLFPEAPVETDKTWPEMVHRYFASGLGLFIFYILVMSRLKQSAESYLPIKLPLFLSVLVVLQGAFGAWTVTLKLWPQVVTAHLLGGFATLSLLWLLVQRTGGCYWQGPAPHVERNLKLRSLAMVAMGLVIVQIALGGWTSSNYAALACTDLPTCHGEYWPESDFAAGFNIFQHVGPNYLGGLLDNHARTAIHITHRLGAMVVSLVLLVLIVLLWRSKFKPAQRFSGIILAALAVQLVLGFSNIYFVLPLWVAVAHNAFGAVLLLVMVTLNHRLQTISLRQ